MATSINDLHDSVRNEIEQRIVLLGRLLDRSRRDMLAFLARRTSCEVALEILGIAGKEGVQLSSAVRKAYGRALTDVIEQDNLRPHFKTTRPYAERRAPSRRAAEKGRTPSCG